MLLLGPQHQHEFRQGCHKCKMCVCVLGGWGVGGLIDGAVNTGVHLDESDSMYEAVRALHAAK